MTIRRARSRTHREDSSAAALCLDGSPLAVAMRDAWTALGHSPFPRWTPATAQVWPHPDRAVRDRFHARVNDLLYTRLKIDPLIKPGTESPGLQLVAIVFDAATETAIVERYRAGESAARIGFDLRVGEDRIRKTLQQHRVTMRKPGCQGNARAAARRALVQQLHAEGKSDQKIAAQLQVSASRVMQLRQLLGLPAHVNPVEKSARMRRAALAAHARRRAAAREAA